MTSAPQGARKRSGRRVYEGTVLALDVDDVEEPGGVRATREVVRHQGSVAVLPVFDDGRVVLVRQYRYAVDAEVWELPAGRLDRGESPEQGAHRELREEVGLTAARLEPIGDFYTTPGFCDERMHLFRATGLSQGEACPEDDERIDVLCCPFEQADAMVRAGEIREGKTLVALLLEARRRDGTGAQRTTDNGTQRAQRTAQRAEDE